MATSSHCHVCQKSSISWPVVKCSDNLPGKCRKIICELYFKKHSWDWSAAKALELVNDGWTCPHCSEACPSVAQCFMYRRVNGNRKKKQTHRFSYRPREPLILPIHFGTHDGNDQAQWISLNSS
mmetsp:Transcript_13714/g.28144  ORF Transcript_13714/g.28144 Transcript_13714/m.28144 type:complete len:124 (-) Transcript_13714:2224-2595(-)